MSRYPGGSENFMLSKSVCNLILSVGFWGRGSSHTDKGEERFGTCIRLGEFDTVSGRDVHSIHWAARYELLRQRVSGGGCLTAKTYEYMPQTPSLSERSQIE